MFRFFSKKQKLQSPYCYIDALPFDPHGWFYNEKPLLDLFSRYKIKNVIEIGSWLGLSTRFFAKQVPPDGQVYAIDTWLGSIEHQGDRKLSCLYQQFLSNVIHTHLTTKITPIRMSSLEAAKGLHVMADLVYIDASHEQTDAYNDIMHWASHIKNGGIMSGDDWCWESVRNAVLQAAFELRQEVKIEDNFWWFEPL